MDKRRLRKQILAQRQSIAGEERARWDQAAQVALVTSQLFEQARTVLIYHPFRGEVATELIAAAAVAEGKRLVLPRVGEAPGQLHLHLYSGDPASLLPGAYGICEPDPAWAEVSRAEVDLVVVPGVAFDRSGGRMGYGGGYYDRLLPGLRAANPAVKYIGLAYELQVVSELPLEEHDVRLDGLVTELGLTRTTP